MLSTQIAALMLGVAAIATAGCGSGGSTTPATAGSAGTGNSTAETSTNTNVSTKTSSPPLTPAVLAASGNVICKRLHAQLQSLNTPKATPNPEQEYAAAAADDRKALASLQKLNPPSKLSTDWKQILTTMGTLAYDANKYREYVRSNELGKANTLVDSYGPIKHSGVVVARRDGLTECALAF